jgi:predicted nucleic acid-binding protein
VSGLLIDTDVLINFLRGREHVRVFFASMAEEHTFYCSAITVAEICVGMKPDEKSRTDELIDGLDVLAVDREIAQKAGNYKCSIRSRALELADCIIAATAFCNRAILVTGNTRHYPMDDIKKLAVR